MKRGQVNARSWDKAILAVQKNMLELAANVPLSDEQDRILTAAFVRCTELTARRYLAWSATNAELAQKYGISPRTVTNWRREGCPFACGQPRVLRWLARRRYAPAGAKARFAKQLRKRKWGLRDALREIRAQVLGERAGHKLRGERMPNWLRGMPFRAR